MLRYVLLGVATISLATGAAAQNPSVSDSEVDAFLNFTTPKANNDWDVSRVRDTCWAIITYKNFTSPKEAVREVSFTHDFAVGAGELRAYSKGENNPSLRELSSGRADFAIYFGRPLAGSWLEKVPLEVYANHEEGIYSFSVAVEVDGLLPRFEQFPGFTIYTSDKKTKLFDGYSEGNATGVPKMKECLTAGGWTPRSSSK